MSRSDDIETTIGVVGGGQLGMFFAQAARALGYRTAVFDPDPECPAALAADNHHGAGYEDRSALETFGRACSAVTVEFENLPIAGLELLAQLTTVRPSPSAVAIAADRVREKELVRSTGVPVAAFEVLDGEARVREIERSRQLKGRVVGSAIVKTARLGYDGKGQRRIGSLEDLGAAWSALGGVTCVVEELLPLDREFSIVLARNSSGECVFYPPTLNHHSGGILDWSVVTQDEPLRDRACDAAHRIAMSLDYCGVLAVEFFVSDGRLLVNEIAPRPHNSGHWTISAARTSQFEQQVRTLVDLPLGSVDTLDEGIAMVNLLGDLWVNGEPQWGMLDGVSGAYLYDYAKREARPGRKMGHLTVVRRKPDEALEVALALRSLLGGHR